MISINNERFERLLLYGLAVGVFGYFIFCQLIVSYSIHFLGDFSALYSRPLIYISMFVFGLVLLSKRKIIINSEYINLLVIVCGMGIISLSTLNLPLIKNTTFTCLVLLILNLKSNYDISHLNKLLKNLWGGLFLTFLFLTIITLIEFKESFWQKDDLTFKAFLGNRNYFGLILVSATLTSYTNFSRRLWPLIWGSSLFMMLMSTSRSSLISLAVSSSWLFIKYKVSIVVVCLNLVSCFLIYALINSSGGHKVLKGLNVLDSRNLDLILTNNRYIDSSNAERKKLLKESFALINQNPILGTRDISVMPKDLKGNNSSPHNFLVLNAMWYGIPYLLLLSVGIFISFRTLDYLTSSLLLGLICVAVFQPFLDFFHLTCAFTILTSIIAFKEGHEKNKYHHSDI